MSPEKFKKKTQIAQNFEIGPNGEIIKRGQILPPKKGITPIPKAPKKTN